MKKRANRTELNRTKHRLLRQLEVVTEAAGAAADDDDLVHWLFSSQLKMHLPLPFFGFFFLLFYLRGSQSLKFVFHGQ